MGRPSFDEEGIRRILLTPAKKHAILSAEQERDLAVGWIDQHDERALQQLIMPYMRLVAKLANDYKNYGLPFADLVGEGSIGMLVAAKRFDPRRNTRFSTYAMWWIRASIQDYILKNWSLVKTGTTANQKKLFFNLRKLKGIIFSKTGREALSEKDIQEVSKALDVTSDEVITMDQRLAGRDFSLNAAIKDDDADSGERIDFLVCERPTPEETLIADTEMVTRKRWLVAAIEGLSPRERNIIHERHLKEDPVTLEALGKQLGISKVRVQQIEAGALRKLKNKMLKKQRGIVLKKQEQTKAVTNVLQKKNSLRATTFRKTRRTASISDPKWAWAIASLEILSAVERTIVSERHLKDDQLTLEELSNKLGISIREICSIESSSLEKLKDHMLTSALNAKNTSGLAARNSPTSAEAPSGSKVSYPVI